MSKFFHNSLRSILALTIAALIFVLLLYLLNLLGAIFIKDFPLATMLKNGFYFLLILVTISLPLGFFISAFSESFKWKKIFSLSLMGFICYWILMVVFILILSKSSHSENFFSHLLKLSMDTMLAYSFYVVPLILSAIMLLGKHMIKR